MPTLRIPAFIVVILLAIAACSGSPSPTPPAAASAQAAGGASGSSAVEIKDLAFNPATITVKTGTKVTWTNNDSTTHTVTFDDNSVDSGDVNVGSTFDHTFGTAGTFAYHCKIHSSMLGTVTVAP